MYLSFRYWLLPGFILKKMIMDNFQSSEVDPDVADGIDFMVERVIPPLLPSSQHFTFLCALQ